MEMRKLLNILNENRGRYTEDQISSLASVATDEAINAAAERVQRELGITDGHYAGIYFSNDESRGYFYDTIKDYIQNEIEHNFPPEEENDGWEDEDDTD